MLQRQKQCDLDLEEVQQWQTHNTGTESKPLSQRQETETGQRTDFKKAGTLNQTK